MGNAVFDWAYKRKKAKKHYEVYAHYFYGECDEFGAPIGETWAYSKEQAERNMSIRCGDGGEREIKMNDYVMCYEAREIS